MGRERGRESLERDRETDLEEKERPEGEREICCHNKRKQSLPNQTMGVLPHHFVVKRKKEDIYKESSGELLRAMTL
jgi:hypothetical protein